VVVSLWRGLLWKCSEAMIRCARIRPVGRLVHAWNATIKRRFSHPRPHVEEEVPSATFITPKKPPPVNPATRDQLLKCALVSAVPMVG
jgi:hypothetical protein